MFCPHGQIGKVGSLKRSSFLVRIQVRAPSLGDGIGIRVGLRSQILRVRVPPEAPNKEAWQSPVYCTCLENRRSERVREFESHRFHQFGEWAGW